MGAALPIIGAVIGAGATIYSAQQQSKAAEDAQRMQEQYLAQQAQYQAEQARMQDETNKLSLEYQGQQKAFQEQQLVLQKELSAQQLADAEASRKLQEQTSRDTLNLQKEQMAKQSVAVPTYEEDLSMDMSNLSELEKKRRKSMSMKSTNLTYGLLDPAYSGSKQLLGM
jgi:hypothetical protein